MHTPQSHDPKKNRPVGLSCGEKILPVQGLADLLTHIARMDFKCVVQKYIERPLLVRK